MEKAFACVLAALLSSAVNRSRVIGCIFFRVSSSGSTFFFVRFIAQLYHVPRTLRIGKTKLLLHAICLRVPIASCYKPVEEGILKTLESYITYNY